MCSDVQGVHTLKIPHGYYKTMADIVSKLNESIIDHDKRKKISHHLMDGKTLFKSLPTAVFRNRFSLKEVL